MCRFVAYKGAPITMERQLFQAKNSLVYQSQNASERERPVSADGFGVGWYERELDPWPAVFVSTSPAWNNLNLRRLAPRVRSRCFFAHVRDALGGPVTEPNCHPFQHREYLMMHNGSIGGFQRIKRTLRALPSDELYNEIRGETDTETFFAIFMTRLLEAGPGGTRSAGEIMEALRQAIREVEAVRLAAGVERPSFLNLAVTNGETVVATRWGSDPSLPTRSLYWARGRRLECTEKGFRAHDSDGGDGEGFAIIASEPLADDEGEEWNPVPPGHFVAVGEDNAVSLEPMGV